MHTHHLDSSFVTNIQLTTVLYCVAIREITQTFLNNARQPKVRHFAFYYASTQPNLYS